MQNLLIYVFFILLISYMFRHCHHPQGAYNKVSLKHNRQYTRNILLIVHYVFIYVFMKSWCKLPDDGNNAEACRS